MSAKSIVAVEVRYVLTDEGREAMRVYATCACRPKMAGLLIQCPDCGTVFGSLRDNADWGRGMGEFKR